MLDIIVKRLRWRERERAPSDFTAEQRANYIRSRGKASCVSGHDPRTTAQMLQAGFASLPDQPRSGGPSNLNDEHRARLKAWIEAEPLTCRGLGDHWETECGLRLSSNTLCNELKRLGYDWKRDALTFKKTWPRTLRTSPTGHSRTNCPDEGRCGRTGVC